MHYELYYWSGIQGRGEFVRLALEDAGADYTDVVREQGDAVMEPFLSGQQDGARPFAPPFLKAGRLVLAQVSAILHYLGPTLELVPEAESRRLQALQLQLTIADLVAEVHDTHHPIASSLITRTSRPRRSSAPRTCARSACPSSWATSNRCSRRPMAGMRCASIPTSTCRCSS
jgi:glutathione S-transferase